MERRRRQHRLGELLLCSSAAVPIPLARPAAAIGWSTGASFRPWPPPIAGTPSHRSLPHRSARPQIKNVPPDPTAAPARPRASARRDLPMQARLLPCPCYPRPLSRPRKRPQESRERTAKAWRSAPGVWRWVAWTEDTNAPARLPDRQGGVRRPKKFTGTRFLFDVIRAGRGDRRWHGRQGQNTSTDAQGRQPAG